jgi:hypothetical protein
MVLSMACGSSTFIILKAQFMLVKTWNLFISFVTFKSWSVSEFGLPNSS